MEFEIVEGIPLPRSRGKPRKYDIPLDEMEVGDNIKEKYISQSKSSEMALLVNGLNVITKADVNYKTSKNPRLLVEFTLIQLCSLSPSEQKKN